MKAFLFLMGLCWVAQGATGIKEGDTIPSITLPTHQGEKD